MTTASSASSTNIARRSASVCNAIVRIAKPCSRLSSRTARMRRTAASPRLTIATRVKLASPSDGRILVPRPTPGRRSGDRSDRDQRRPPRSRQRPISRRARAGRGVSRGASTQPPCPSRAGQYPWMGGLTRRPASGRARSSRWLAVASRDSTRARRRGHDSRFCEARHGTVTSLRCCCRPLSLPALSVTTVWPSEPL